MKRLRRNPVSSLGKNRPAKTSGAISVPFLFAVALKESSLPPFLPPPPLPPFYIKNELSPPTTNGVRAFDRVVAPLLFDKSRDDLSSPLLRSSEFLMHYFPSSTLAATAGKWPDPRALSIRRRGWWSWMDVEFPFREIFRKEEYSLLLLLLG